MPRELVRGCPRSRCRAPTPGYEHEIAEATTCSVKGTLKESRIDAAEPCPFREAFLEFLQQHHENEGARVVVGAVAMFVVGKRINGVLEHSRVIHQAP